MDWSAAHAAVVFEPNRFLVVFSLIILGSAMILWPLGWFFRLPALNKPGVSVPSYRRFFSFARYFTTLLILISFGSYFYIRSHPDLIHTSSFPGITPDAGWLENLMLALPTMLSVLTFVQILVWIPVWSRHHGTRIFRLHYSLVVLALLVYLFFLIKWNLVVPGLYLEFLI